MGNPTLANRFGPMGEFRCPEECLECCQVKYMGGLYRAKESFKCISKKTPILAEAPGGRTCDHEGDRDGNPNQYKYKCQFTDAEQSFSAHSSLGHCSHHFKCCCREDDDWTEDLCLPMDSEESVVTAVAKMSKKEESFKLAEDQMVENRYFHCAGSEQSVKHQRVGSEEHLADGDLTSEEGCCLATAPTEEKDGEVFSPLHEGAEEVGVCAKWQMVYACTADGGQTQSGKLYRRVANSTHGFCIGDESTPDTLSHTYGSGWDFTNAKLVASRFNQPKTNCPNGFRGSTEERACECAEACN